MPLESSGVPASVAAGFARLPPRSVPGGLNAGQFREAASLSRSNRRPGSVELSPRTGLVKRLNLPGQPDGHRTLEVTARMAVRDRSFALVKPGAPKSPLPERQFRSEASRLFSKRIVFS